MWQTPKIRKKNMKSDKYTNKEFNVYIVFVDCPNFNQARVLMLVQHM